MKKRSKLMNRTLEQFFKDIPDCSFPSFEHQTDKEYLITCVYVAIVTDSYHFYSVASLLGNAFYFKYIHLSSCFSLFFRAHSKNKLNKVEDI